ncbi:hypothetical protein C8R45DRAFT_1089957 [Mycena sanguinolenta]|nr:hypothetical protein C8R45DRAFT_1089957 [Mycena sanguinolenta]
MSSAPCKWGSSLMMDIPAITLTACGRAQLRVLWVHVRGDADLQLQQKYKSIYVLSGHRPSRYEDETISEGPVFISVNGIAILPPSRFARRRRNNDACARSRTTGKEEEKIVERFEAVCDPRPGRSCNCKAVWQPQSPSASSFLGSPLPPTPHVLPSNGSGMRRFCFIFLSQIRDSASRGIHTSCHRQTCPTLLLSCIPPLLTLWDWRNPVRAPAEPNSCLRARCRPGLVSYAPRPQLGFAFRIITSSTQLGAAQVRPFPVPSRLPFRTVSSPDDARAHELSAHIRGAGKTSTNALSGTASRVAPSSLSLPASPDSDETTRTR